MQPSFFSIVIVNWNSRELLRNCLNSIYRFERNNNYEIIVVDNDSSDGSVEMVHNDFKKVILIANQENRGFARATNQGIQISKGDIVLLLNSDAELKEENTLKRVAQFLVGHPEIGILGVDLVFPDGVSQGPGGSFISIWQLFKHQVLFLNSPFYFKVKDKFRKFAADDHYEIDFVTGACMFVRKEVFIDIGLLNERFFMYGEDMEFCFRANKHGWQNAILKSVQVIHLKGQSTKKNIAKILGQGINNNCSLIEEFYGRRQRTVAHVIYEIGLFLRLLLALITKGQSPLSYLNLLKENLKMIFPFGKPNLGCRNILTKIL